MIISGVSFSKDTFWSPLDYIDLSCLCEFLKNIHLYSSYYVPGSILLLKNYCCHHPHFTGGGTKAQKVIFPESPKELVAEPGFGPTQAGHRPQPEPLYSTHSPYVLRACHLVLQ